MDYEQRKRAAQEALKTVKVGDEVFYTPHSIYRQIPRLILVEKVTPTGLVDVRIYGKAGDKDGLKRFRAGVEVGATRWRKDSIEAATPERRAEVEAELKLRDLKLRDLRKQAHEKMEKLKRYYADHHLDAASCEKLIALVDGFLPKVEEVAA